MATQRKSQSSKRQQAKASARASAARSAANAARPRQAVATRPAAEVTGTGAVTAGTMAGTAPAARVAKAQPRPAEGGGSGPSGRSAAKEQRPAPSVGSAWQARTEGVRRLVADTRAELRRVNWPDQETTRALTIVVIAISAALGILLGGIDFVLFQLFEAL
ncbi:MAG: preprotein translocase subunit SecE [Thermomicrobiales bacterium]